MEKILVIEDAHLLRNDIIETLNLEGYEVVGAENGLIGVEMARKHIPDLIICDIMMPELDGYEVLEALREDTNLAMIPFIFMTAKTDKTDIRLGMGLGADDYLTKPFLTTDLLKSIRARLGKRALVDQHAEQKLDQLRENILTALPHELRTPLNTILGFSEMLMMEHERIEPEQVDSWAQHINKAALRLYRLIENYLVYVRVETMARNSQQSNSLRPNRAHSPGALVQLQAQQKAQQLGREADIQMDIQDAVAVMVSEQDLGKVVEELVDNAIKFSTAGTPITVKTRVEDGFFVLAITDYGKGMAADQIANIGAYMQYNRWLMEQQGMGLGLTIAKRMAELSGGSLQIDSELEQYTTVIVKLPLAADGE